MKDLKTKKDIIISWSDKERELWLWIKATTWKKGSSSCPIKRSLSVLAVQLSMTVQFNTRERCRPFCWEPSTPKTYQERSMSWFDLWVPLSQGCTEYRESTKGKSRKDWFCPWSTPHSTDEMSKWLAEQPKPVVDKYSTQTIKDTFQFCKELEEFQADHNSLDKFLCSFDSASLLMNIPLEKTLDICLDTLYWDKNVNKPTVPERLMRKLLVKSMTGVEFSFNGDMYRQTDGVAKGSPLGPNLANVFVDSVRTSLPLMTGLCCTRGLLTTRSPSSIAKIIDQAVPHGISLKSLTKWTQPCVSLRSSRRMAMAACRSWT